jgi:hypothetical protein
MARGKKKQTDKTETSVERPVDKHQLIALVKESYATKEQTSAIAGAFGERVKNAVENGRLNRKVFRTICMLHRMPELERQAYIRDYELYKDMAQEGGLFGDHHVGNMIDDMERDDGSTEEETIIEANKKALSRIAQLSDEDYQRDVGGSAVPPQADEADAAIPAFMDRRNSKSHLTVIDGEPVH